MHTQMNNLLNPDAAIAQPMDYFPESHPTPPAITVGLGSESETEVLEKRDTNPNEVNQRDFVYDGIYNQPPQRDAFPTTNELISAFVGLDCDEPFPLVMDGSFPMATEEDRHTPISIRVYEDFLRDFLALADEDIETFGIEFA